jgi:hypothetical protein
MGAVKSSSLVFHQTFKSAGSIEQILFNHNPGQVSFVTKFPQPGKHKLWGPLNWNGKIVVADFWVNAL